MQVIPRFASDNKKYTVARHADESFNRKAVRGVGDMRVDMIKQTENENEKKNIRIPKYIAVDVT